MNDSSSELKATELIGLPLRMKQRLLRRDKHHKERRDKRQKQKRVPKPRPKKTAVLRQKKRQRNAANARSPRS